jgi:hypothetical protein
MKTGFLSHNPGAHLSILPEHCAEDYIEELEDPIVEHISSNIGNASRRTEELYQDDGKLSAGSQTYHDAQLEDDESLQKRGWFVTFVSRRITLPKRAWRLLEARRIAINSAAATNPRKGIFMTSTIQPYSSLCLTWTSFMLLFDLTFTVRDVTNTLFAVIT